LGQLLEATILADRFLVFGWNHDETFFICTS
jgi:hypothetical protein